MTTLDISATRKPTPASGEKFSQGTLQDVGLHDQITAIDESDENRLYAIDKLEAHVANIRHIAVSIFVFKGNQLLLQRRAKTKYHSAGLWANTVCSHPRWNETAADCAQRRLNDELGWQVPLQGFGTIDYSVRVGELFENEHVHCFYGLHNDEHDVSKFNPVEVDDTQWLTVPELHDRIKSHPQLFSEWLKIYMAEHRDMIDSLVSRI